jgi:pimeloyl-ACP methyl ester carboxylesterase
MNKLKIPTVLLLHGYLRTARGMNYLKRFFIKNGFDTIVPTLPVTTAGIERCSALLYSILSGHSWETLHMVGHSSGGRIILDILTRYDIPGIGNIVLISTPVNGSAAANFLSALPYADHFSRTLADLSVPAEKFPAGNKIGVIAAGTGMKFGFNPFISGDNDDLVAVSETRFNGMHDFVLRRFRLHQFVHKNAITANLVRNFLLTASFGNS